MRRLLCTALTLGFCALPSISSGQQYVTDDAAVTDYRACQIQVWHGERSSWAMPVCTPLRNVEASAGVVIVWDDESDGHTEYVAQLKTLLIPREGRWWGLGFVIGTGRDPGLAGIRNPGWNTYAYLPVTVGFANERLLFHNNVGYSYDHRAGDDNDRQLLTLASRADVFVRKYLVIVGEIYDSSGSEAEYQAGVRTWTRPGKVQLDLSYGGFLTRTGRAAGWTLGIALTTPPFL